MRKEQSVKILHDSNNDATALCSYLSAISYQHKKDQYDWLVETFQLSDYYQDETNYISYYTVKDEARKNFYVVIRGTHADNFKCWVLNMIVNLQFKLLEESCYKIHSGYRKCGEPILKKLVFSIKEAADKGYNVVFTGHSLGGAIAKYVAVKSELDESNIYTFGSPLLATDDFFDIDGTMHIRDYVISDDIISFFPSRIFSKQPYFEIGSDNKLMEKIRPTNILHSRFLLNELKIVFFYRSILKNHAMDHYHRKVLKSI